MTALDAEALSGPHGLAARDIGVIAMYRAQVKRVRERLGRPSMPPGAEGVLVGTVDASQGAERSVVIVTTSVSSRGGAATARRRSSCALRSRANAATG